MFKFFSRNNENDSGAITDDSKMVNHTPSSSAFKMPPAATEAGPLQQLSPERVNNAGRLISTSTTTTHKSTITSESESFDIESSPTRRAKANLFGDYSPNKHTPSDPKTIGFALPQSPSLPEIHAFRSHVRTNSDVQGLVKRFEHLDVRDRDAESQERRKRHEAELRRAQIAREEAESDVRRLREEMRRLKKEGEEGRERERKLGRRVEVVQEELNTARAGHDSESGVYEKEMKKARKEAFKSSSAVLKLQEELKSTRNTLKITQQGFDLEKQKVNRKEQERFEMEYQLIPLQEQMEKLKQQLKVAQEEREALKTNLREEEVARIAAEGMIALPVSETMDLDLMSSPRKAASPKKVGGMFEMMDEDKENMGGMSRKASENRRMAEELERERMRREHAEEMIDFLQMECRFHCCGCRGATSSGHRLAVELDAELAAAVERIRAGMLHILTPQMSFDEGYGTQEDGSQATTAPAVSQLEDSQAGAMSQQTEVAPVDTPMLDEAPMSRAATPANDRSPGDQLLAEEEEWLSNSPPKPQPPAPETQAPSIEPVDLRPSTPPPQPQTSPQRNQPSIRTVTTTTTVPMHFTPISKPVKINPSYTNPTHSSANAVSAWAASEHAIEDAENIPPTPSTAAKLEGLDLTFDREAALKMIEYRRGRAKSIANATATPRKQMLEGLGARRDISAPALGQNVPKSVGSLKGKTK